MNQTVPKMFTVSGAIPKLICEAGTAAVRGAENFLRVLSYRDKKKIVRAISRLNRFVDWCRQQHISVKQLNKAFLENYEIYLRANFKDDEARQTFKTTRSFLDQLALHGAIHRNPARLEKGIAPARMSLVEVEGALIPAALLNEWGEIPVAITELGKPAVTELGKFFEGRRESTMRYYALALLPLCCWCTWNRHSLRNLNEESAKEYVDFLYQHYAYKEARSRIRCARELLSWCMEKGLVTNNPFPDFVRKVTGPRKLGVPIPSVDETSSIPSVICAAGEQVSKRYCDFIGSLPSHEQRRAAARYNHKFFKWCEEEHIAFRDVTTPTIGAFAKHLASEYSAGMVYTHLMYLRQFYDHLIDCDVCSLNPVAQSTMPKQDSYKFFGVVPSSMEVNVLFQVAESTHSLSGLRDRVIFSLAFNALLTVAEISALNVGDFYQQEGRYWLRIRGSKEREVPANPAVEQHITEYIEAAGIKEEFPSPLIRRTHGGTDKLSNKRLGCEGIRCRFCARRDQGKLPNYLNSISVRRAGIRAFLEGGGSLEKAAKLSGVHATTIERYLDPRSPTVIYEGDLDGLLGFLSESAAGPLHEFVRRNRLFKLSITEGPKPEEE